MRAPVFPPKLRRGDTIRVVAPSRSRAILGTDNDVHCARRFEELGLRVTFGAHVQEMDMFRSSAVASRVADLHDAFADPDVRGVMTAIGGFNANQLLGFLDWDLIAAHPKVFCGYSDITALSNAIFAKTGLVAYSGPHWSTFGMAKGLEDTVRGFRRCVMEEGPFEVEPAAAWSDDPWFEDQENRTFHPSPGPRTLRAGVAEGTAVGGNLCTLNLLQGTEWMPSLDGAVVFVEEDAQAGPLGAVEFDRNLQSLLHLPGAQGIRGLAIGRFEPGSEMTDEMLRAIVASKRELARVPVACGLDFGHTTPIFTFPVGGTVRLDCSQERARLTILAH